MSENLPPHHVNPEWPPPPPYAPAHRRSRGPAKLLVAVAIVAAAVGGTTAYGVQELTGGSSTGVTASSATETDVVPASLKGTVAGVAKSVSPSIVEIKAASSSGSATGSGVVVTEDGEVVTNNHVVAAPPRSRCGHTTARRTAPASSAPTAARTWR